MIQWRTRSPSRAATTSAYSANASTVSRDGPAAAILERLRQVPVVERDERLDAVREQLVDEAVVEVEAGGVHAAAALGEDPRPRDREAVGVETERAHQADVVAIAVVGVARDAAVVAVEDLPGRRREAVPDALAAAVLGHRALDLVGGGRGAPDEPVGKRAADRLAAVVVKR